MGIIAGVVAIVLLGTGVVGAQVVTLAEATARALETHESVQGARIDERRADVASWKAWTLLFPSVEATGSYTREKDEIAFPESLATLGALDPVILQKRALRGSLRVRQPVWSPQFPALADLVEADRARAVEELRIARQDVRLAVAQAYYGALHARASREIAEETVALAEVQAERARAREAVGDALPSDLLGSETQVERARHRVAEAAAAIETARLRLVRLSALEEGFELAPAPAPGLDLSSPEPFVVRARERSPEIRRAERAVEAARAEERRLRALVYPTLGVDLQYKLVDRETFAERNDFWEVVAGLRVPLVSEGGASWVAWREQKVRVERIGKDLAGVRRDVELAVREAFVAAKTLMSRETLSEREERLAIESHRVLAENYAEGRASSVDLLASLAARNEARSERALVRFDRALALLRLERAAGVLGEEPRTRCSDQSEQARAARSRNASRCPGSAASAAISR